MGGACGVSPRPVRLAPHPHPGGACAARGSGPPTRPRIFFLWGLRPHAPSTSAHTAQPWEPAPSRRGRTPALSLGERAGVRASENRPRLLWGLRPHTPSRTSTRCARLWPTHPPSDLLSVGASPPRPPPGSGNGTRPLRAQASLWGATPPTPPSTPAHAAWPPRAHQTPEGVRPPLLGERAGVRGAPDPRARTKPPRAHRSGLLSPRAGASAGEGFRAVATPRARPRRTPRRCA